VSRADADTLRLRAYDHFYGPKRRHELDSRRAGGTYHYSATALAVFWPAIEHGKLIARWPHLTTDVGATWDEHRRLVERHCTVVAQAGHGVSQTPGDIDGFEAFLRDKRIRTPSSDDLRAYPDLRAPPWCLGHQRGPRLAGAARDASTSNVAARTVWAPWTDPAGLGHRRNSSDAGSCDAHDRGRPSG